MDRGDRLEVAGEGLVGLDGDVRPVVLPDAVEELGEQLLALAEASSISLLQRLAAHHVLPLGEVAHAIEAWSLGSSPIGYVTQNTSTIVRSFSAANFVIRLTLRVARDLTVLAVGASRQPGADTTSVAIALPDASLASELALANDDATLNLLREGGEGRAAPIPTAHAPAR